MSYRSETIAVAVNRMNRQYLLPAIQREFIWKPDQIVQLFDSILRGYPISSFLFWELKAENRDKWQVYEFLERAKHGGTHNVQASTDGVPTLHLVLDGQQRLTSLLIGLKGTYEMKKKYKRWDNPDAWSAERLHLDLLAEPTLDESGDESRTYFRLQFLHETPPPNADNNWFRLGRILDFDERKKFDAFLDKTEEDLSARGHDKTDRKVCGRNLQRLYDAVHMDEVIAYYTEADQDYDRVLDIFVRANEGGTKLSKSDLLLSMAIASWGDMNARDAIFNFVDRINTKLTRRNDFDKDFIMKSCLVLSDLPVAYKVQNFSQANLDLIRRNWTAIRHAVERGVDLVNSFGIDRDNLTSANALIPAIYFLLKNPATTLRGSSAFEVRNADRIRRWVIMVLLRGAFGRAADSLLTDIRSAIQATPGAGTDFPVEAINSAISKTGLSAAFDEGAIESVLDLAYDEKQTFLALSLLYDDAAWGTLQFHKDHLFARSRFKPKELTLAGRDDWIDKKDRLGNLCLLLASENQGKQDLPLEDWLRSRDRDFLRRHLIPEDRTLWAFDRFPEFVRAREDLIRRRLQTLFTATPI